MKLSFAAFFGFAIPVSAVFQPTRISYADLMKGDVSTKTAFTNVLSEVGMVSITSIPFTRKTEALSLLHKCALESKVTQEHTFPDGTRRLTLASHSVPGGIQKINHKISSEACDSFDESSEDFRATVEIVTQAFARVLGRSFGLEKENEMTEPLLSTTDGFAFDSFVDLVEHGEHLEHFHSYEKLQESSISEETIEMHLDQGLFIAFTPGRLVRHEQGSVKTEITSGFFIELRDGSIEEAKFDENDDIVFLLGDGVNQYINEKLVGSSPQLRAVPHALIMNSHEDSFSRVWYGRMVLPPVDAVHPSQGISFGMLRESMILSSLENQEVENAGLGCSGGMIARDLSATSCEEDATYCWHRCMKHMEFNVSTEECSARGLQVHCINPRLQLWEGVQHGDYYPACASNSTFELETPFPTLDEFPRSEELCTDEEFLSFADSSGYEFSHELPGGAMFMWSIKGDEVHGRIAYNGLFGWLAFGFADVDGKKNGMHGANVLMALPGGNYSGFSGLDLSLPANINQYQVHDSQTPFRYWQTPLSIATSRSVNENDHGIESTECFTAMSFETRTIGKYTFNLQGRDELIWAANGENSYMQYHGPNSRGRFAIDWSTGDIIARGSDVIENPDEQGGPNPSSSSTPSRAFIIVFMVASMSFLIL